MIEPIILQDSLLEEIRLRVNHITENVPNKSTDLNRRLPTEYIRKNTGDESAKPGTSGHGGSDATLYDSIWTLAFIRSRFVALRLLA